ncbi:hypothetical protein BG32_10275 [Mesotoga sp. HF07.pep.5.2.highcov]|nr:hypothetical protein BG32_10275 [Mesotoga sp. HF07.pep.5.2.highcov]
MLNLFSLYERKGPLVKTSREVENPGLLPAFPRLLLAVSVTSCQGVNLRKVTVVIDPEIVNQS